MEPDVECPDVDPETFSEKGFTILPELIAPKVCEALNVRLEHLLKGDYDLGVAPSKVPGAKELRRYGSGGSKVNTLRIVDAWKADALFQRVVLSPVLGRLAATLGGWSGARVAEDQVWIKPPGAGPLVFHRDSPYFDFEPDHVITYVVGSHRWEGRRGTAAQFFDPSHRQLMEDAARQQGLQPEQVDVVPVLVKQGGAGCHDGCAAAGKAGLHFGTPDRGSAFRA
ncbi:unnamed protein product [Durusdinium trenchii]|uniref:Uncharacterized protein n=1 Tax=Durusdinium trenchii TaxID=1381693 RepID=A0ABP0S198_9DINO